MFSKYQVLPIAKEILHREDMTYLESEMMMYESTPRYYAVVGPRGSGKSSSILKIGETIPMLNYTVNADSTNDLFRMILSKHCPDELQRNPNIATSMFVIPLFRKLFFNRDTKQIIYGSQKSPDGDIGYLKVEKNRTKFLPIVVIDIDSYMSPSVITNMAKNVKSLCSDTGVCKGVLLLSDAYGSYALPKGDSRATIVWIDDFTEQEAMKYFDMYNFMQDNHTARMQIIADYGTRPVELKMIVDAKGDYLEVLKELDINARYNVLQIGTDDSPITKAYNDLIQLAVKSPNMCVDIGDVPSDHPFVHVSKVGDILREYHVLMFNQKRKEYCFHNRATERFVKKHFKSGK